VPRVANTHARSIAALDVQGRVAAQLLAFASEYGEGMPDGNARIPLRLTQRDLAALVGPDLDPRRAPRWQPGGETPILCPLSRGSLVS